MELFDLYLAYRVRLRLKVDSFYFDTSYNVCLGAGLVVAATTCMEALLNPFL